MSRSKVQAVAALHLLTRVFIKECRHRGIESNSTEGLALAELLIRRMRLEPTTETQLSEYAQRAGWEGVKAPTMH